MALKAMLILASVMAIAYALPAPDDNLELVQVPIDYIQGRGDTVAASDLVASADESGWGQPAPQVVSSGWGWEPPKIRFKYLTFKIPIPQLPRIRFGIKGGLKINAALQNKGWGWRR